jgi:hypothetical protein
MGETTKSWTKTLVLEWAPPFCWPRADGPTGFGAGDILGDGWVGGVGGIGRISWVGGISWVSWVGWVGRISGISWVGRIGRISGDNSVSGFGWVLSDSGFDWYSDSWVSWDSGVGGRISGVGAGGRLGGVRGAAATDADLAVGQDLLFGASHLSSAEGVHAGVIRVIHKVVDGVNTSTWAAVLASGASASSSALRRSVIDHITGTRASTLEHVIETQPMSDFVSQRLSLIIVCQASSRQTGIKDHNTIIFRVTGIVGWEGGIAKKSLAGTGFETDGVDVEGGCVAFAELALHFGLSVDIGADTGEPCGIAGAGGLLESEGDTARAVVIVHSINAGLDLAIGNVSSGEIIALGDNVPDDIDRTRTGGFDRDEVCGIRAEALLVGGDSSLVQVRSATTCRSLNGLKGESKSRRSRQE